MLNSSHCRALTARPGFALVVTLSLMILLTVIAVGLLTLSSVSLRSSTQGMAMAQARANARLALILALGELQKAAGDDRRVTVDGSIYEGAKNPNVVGIWKSWSPKLAENPTAGTRDYGSPKDRNFVTWLTSSVAPAELAARDWAKSGTLANPVDLFTQKSDGFLLTGSKIEIKPGSPSAGVLAWTLVQDATRAKINVAGPENADRLVTNSDLQAQPRPSLAKADSFKQPVGQWNQRAGRVITMGQSKLDADLWKTTPPTPEGGDFTAQGYGLLTDVVNGGLKTDLSLGFEMTDANFNNTDTWGTFKNPFRAANAPLTVPTNYKGERPLFLPLAASASIHTVLSYSQPTIYEYPGAAVPTFAALRSFYRTPYHVYNTADGPTIFERGMDHVAVTTETNQGNTARTNWNSPVASPPGNKSQTSYRPVLDRMLFILSMGLSNDPNYPDRKDQLRIIITPVVTLWNPYNVALEIEGAVAYPNLDMAFTTKFDLYDENNKRTSLSSGFLSHKMGSPTTGTSRTARTVAPYFFAAITPNGRGTVGGGQSIRFQPGEVRIFVPLPETPKDFAACGAGTTTSDETRTIYLKPVNSESDLIYTGGFALSLSESDDTTRKDERVITNKGKVSVSSFTLSSYNVFITGLEDATRAKSPSTSSPPQPSEIYTHRGQAVSEVQTIAFPPAGADIRSIVLEYSELANPTSRKPFAVIETYHRVAHDSSPDRKSDLVYTSNPRQAYVNNYLTTGTFVVGPHYETKVRGISSYNEALNQTDGRNAFYGYDNSAGGGRSHLTLFDVPRAPLLSLAAFQHSDLAGTCYSPANQFGNSWASAYLNANTAAILSPPTKFTTNTSKVTVDRAPMPIYDYSYLANEALWDSFFFSGAAPTLTPGSVKTGDPTVWDKNIATVTQDYQTTLTHFIDDPVANPLANPRMTLHLGNATTSTLKTDLVKPEGCLQIGAHLKLDGAFNINSTSKKAWVAFLSGMRDLPFNTTPDPTKAASSTKDSSVASGSTAFPRFRNPMGTDKDAWLGFRSLTDTQVATLADELIKQIKKRGPFLSLGEFVNRRIDQSDMSLKGAIQAAIDGTGLNSASLYDTFDTSAYPAEGQANISPPNTGVGTPGYLTQADLLQAIGPMMTARSDTFTLRAYGEAKDSSGKVLASAWCEAVVQRMPEFIDPSDPPHTAIADLKSIANRTFGRRFSIMSFRYLAKSEVGL